jgi:uncharacterized membrane protein
VVCGVQFLDKDEELKILAETVKALSARVEKLETQLAQNSKLEDFAKISDYSEPNASISESREKVESSEAPNSHIGLADPSNTLKSLTEAVIENSTSLSAHFDANPAVASDFEVPSSLPPPLHDRARPVSAPAESESLETKIGLYWLSKLGMAFVVLGVALLIGYSFQYFGPIAKIATGFIISAVLLVAGEFFERKQKLPGFGQVLCGGAWSLAYFTSYAMHHIESVRVISDPIYGAIVMTAVALCAAYHSFRKNSELVASLAVCLGYLTLSLSSLNIFSALASTVLTLTLSFMTIKKKWATLYTSGLFSALAVFSISIEPQLAGARAPDLPLYLAFLVPYVLSAGILPTILREDNSASRSGAAAVNVTAATVLVLSLIHAFARLTLPIDSNALAFGIVCVTYAIFALFARQRGCPDNALTDSLIALSSLTLFFPAVNKNEPTLAAWAIELGLLIFVGMKYELRSFRIFALLLAFGLSLFCLVEAFSSQTIVAMGLSFPRAIPRILPSVIVMAVACYLYQSANIRNVSNLSERESKLSFYWYAHCLGALLWFAIPGLVYFGKVLTGEAANRILVFVWIIEAFGLGLLGLRWQRPYFSLWSIFGFLSIGICWFLPGAHHLLTWGLQLALMFYLAFQFRRRNGDTHSALIYRSYALIAALFMLTEPPGLAQNEFGVAITCAELLGASYLSYRWGDGFLKQIALLVAILVFSRALLDPHNSWIVISLCCAALTGAAIFIRRSDLAILGEGKRSAAPTVMNVGASIALAAHIGSHLQNSLVSVGWAVEGVFLLAIGFATKDKILRICGLLSFALVILRLLFVDLSGANTIYRIIAFIGAGVLFMVAAYAYARFNKKFEESTTSLSDHS